MKKYLFILLTACTAFYSCSKDDPPVSAVYDPNIVFIEPVQMPNGSDQQLGQILSDGDSIHMEVEYSFPGNTIFYVGLWLINLDTEDTVYSYSEYADLDDYAEVHQHYLPVVSDTTHYSVVAWTANKDQSQTVSDLRRVTIKP